MATKNDAVSGATVVELSGPADVLDDVLGELKESGQPAVSEVGEVIDAEYKVTPDGIDDVPTVPGLQAEIARLTAALSSRDRLEAEISAESTAVDRAATEVLRCEGAVEEAKGDLKSAKERYDKRVNALRDLVRDMAVGQGHLDFSGTATEIVAAMDAVSAEVAKSTPPLVDPATTAPVSELGKKKIAEIVGQDEFDRAKNSEEPIGLTPAQVETIEGDGCQTIADLEKKLRDYPLFLTDLKGFGPAAQNRLTASLAAWRRVHPMVERVEEAASE